MFDWSAYFIGFGVIFTACCGLWLVSLLKEDVSIVDSLWPMMFLFAAITYLVSLAEPGPRGLLVLAMTAIWSLRLFGYITWRNWGEPEDRRYQQIRANNQPNFHLKSFFIVFFFQGLIAWIVSLPLLLAIAEPAPLGWIDYAGITLWVIGMVFEAGGDFQLARFKANPSNRGAVMRYGLWRYTRHPNYFGNACLWWGFGLLALAGGAWWVLISPLLMTFLLLKVSGVSLLEQDIGERRPGYAEYVKSTSPFLPLPPRGGVS